MKTASTTTSQEKALKDKDLPQPQIFFISPQHESPALILLEIRQRGLSIHNSVILLLISLSAMYTPHQQAEVNSLNLKETQPM